ncbi:MAG: hypothetical protein MUF73_08565, partial [Rhodobacteraceae bacterium]|nr:hypothetical protein [Paracoccaceae bacterium]
EHVGLEDAADRLARRELCRSNSNHLSTPTKPANIGTTVARTAQRNKHRRGPGPCGTCPQIRRTAFRAAREDRAQADTPNRIRAD